MFRKFDPLKTVQAIAAILRSHRHETASKLRVLKILYIADRENIRDNGFPMFGCRAVAMDHGPLHSVAKDLIDGEHIEEPLFHSHFNRDGYLLQLKEKDPGVGRLSRCEIEKLQEVCDRVAAMSDWDIAYGITHQFKEWIEKYKKGTSQVIPLEDIIAAVGRAGDQDGILEELRNEYNAIAAFGVPSP